MNLKLEEAKKVIFSPIVIALTVIFILFNILVIYENSYIKEDLKIINNIVDEFGYEIYDEMLNNMKSKYEKQLIKLNQITMNKFKKTYDSVSDFLDSDEYNSNYYREEVFTKEELKFFNEVNLLEVYIGLSTDLVTSYESIDIMAVAKNEIKMYGLTGGAKDLVYKNYEKLSERFDDLVKNKEHKNLFFLGDVYRTHTLLFRDIFSKCIYEIIILVVLITSYLINYEFDNKTSLLVYSTKRGRNNTKDKFIVCIIAAIILSLIIIGVTLLAYFITFDYSKLYNVQISSAFNWEYKFPYISWFNISFIMQTVLCTVVVTIASVIFSAITFIISKLVKNSYIVFFIFFIIFGCFMILPTIIGSNSSLFIYSHYSIFNLILNPHIWFIGFNPITMSKYYEVITIITSTLIVALGSIFVFKRFKKQDLC